MAELRAGGLAIIIKSRFKGNIGKVVKTDRFIGVSEPYNVNCWSVTAICDLQGTSGPLKKGLSGVAPSHSLMPIDGEDFSHEKESEKELQNA